MITEEEWRQQLAFMNLSEEQMVEWLQQLKALDKPPKPSAADEQTRLLAEVQTFNEHTLKPHFGIPQAAHPEHPFHTDITVEWRKKTLVFTRHLYSPHEQKTILFDFARLSKFSDDAFNLSYVLSGGKSRILFERVSLAECLKAMLSHPLLCP